MTRTPARLRSLARAAALLLLAGGVAPRVVRGDDLEPMPPLLFFPEPDAEGKKEIETIIDSEFGSTDTAPHGPSPLTSKES